MQIYGIGTDIVNVQRIEKLWKKHNSKFAEKILSDTELKNFRLQLNKTAFLAKRFAAKEAVAKALGSGFSQDVYIRNISIITQESGKPTVEYLGVTKQFVANLGDVTTNISISDEKEYVLAFAVVTAS